jgi:hypothetical protein
MVSPFAQASNAAQQEEEEEHADFTWEKWLYKSPKKVLLVAPKFILWDLEMGL